MALRYQWLRPAEGHSCAAVRAEKGNGSMFWQTARRHLKYRENLDLKRKKNDTPLSKETASLRSKSLVS